MTTDTQTGLTIREVAIRLGVRSHTVRQRIWDGRLQASKDDGGQWRISAAGVEEWERERAQ